MKRLIALLTVMALGAAVPARAQVAPDIWKGVAEKIDLGTRVRLGLRDGRNLDAVLVAVRDEALVVQPKVRVAVPPQEIPYTAIASLERRKGEGVGAAKAAAIGVATGVGTFFGILLIMLSVAVD